MIYCKLRGQFRVIGPGFDSTFDNLLQDVLFADLSSTPNLFGTWYCQLGSGGNAPTQSDNALGQIAYARASDSVLEPTATLSGSIISARKESTHNFTNVSGDIREIGVNFSANNNAVAHVRTLIKDPAGNPTTIKLSSPESITVVYTLRIDVSAIDMSGNFTISGQQYAYTARPMRLKTLSDYLAVSVSPSSNGKVANGVGLFQIGSSADPTGSVAVGGIASGAQIGGVMTTKRTMLPTGANVSGGISWWGISTAASDDDYIWQYAFSPALPKDDSKQYSFDFQHSFARA